MVEKEHIVLETSCLTCKSISLFFFTFPINPAMAEMTQVSIDIKMIGYLSLSLDINRIHIKKILGFFNSKLIS